MNDLHKSKKISIRKQKNILLDYLSDSYELRDFITDLYKNEPRFVSKIYDKYIFFKENRNLELDSIKFDYSDKNNTKIVRKRTTDKTPILLS